MAVVKANTYQLLRNKYPESECVLMQEVSDTTGGRNRSADYIVVNLWPSRGNSIIGFEEKTYRSDWLSELKNPKKQEPIFKYCDFFYLITSSESVAKIEEIPVNWGWMHCKGNRITIMKQAPKLSPEPLSRQFICSMLRRAASKADFVHKDSIEQHTQAKVAEALSLKEREFSNMEKNYKRLEENVAKFESAAGFSITDKWFDRELPQKFGTAVKAITSGVIQTKEQIECLNRLQKSFQIMMNSIQSGITDLTAIQEISQSVNIIEKK